MIKKQIDKQLIERENGYRFYFQGYVFLSNKSSKEFKLFNSKGVLLSRKKVKSASKRDFINWINQKIKKQ